MAKYLLLVVSEGICKRPCPVSDKEEELRSLVNVDFTLQGDGYPEVEIHYGNYRLYGEDSDSVYIVDTDTGEFVSWLNLDDGGWEEYTDLPKRGE